MSSFQVELKKVVDDSYEVQIGKDLMPALMEDLANGLAGKIKKFAVITDSTVEKLYAEPILGKIHEAGYAGDMFVFPAGEKSKVRSTKEQLEDAMLAKGYRRDCCVIAVGGGVVTDLDVVCRLSIMLLRYCRRQMHRSGEKRQLIPILPLI